MKLTLHLRPFYLSVLCLSSSILHFQSVASETPKNGSEIAISRQNLEAIRGACQRQLHALDQSLSDTIQLLASKIVSIDDHEQKLETLVNLRINVGSLLQEVRNMTISTPEVLNLYLDIIEKLSLHIDAMFSDLSIIKPFEYVPDKSVRIEENELQATDISLQYLDGMAQYNDDIVQKITKKQSKLGLSTYNTIFRKIDAFCSKHYNKFNVALKAGVISTVALAYLYRFSPFNKFFGESPVYIGGKLDNQKDLGFMGKGDDYLRDIAQTAYHPITWPIISSAAGTLYAMGSHHIKKYLNKARNYLKGGIYKNYADESYEANRMASDKTFDDIVGLKNAMQQLNAIVEFLKNPEPYARIGAIPPKGILLYGPPGTGKTHIVEAMSGEIKKAFEGSDKEFKFYHFDAHTVLTHGMKLILEIMQNEAPCVIFVDEIDMLQLQRNGNPKLLANFLEGMSGIMQGQLSMDLEKQVIVIAATNQIENLDKALLRPGRFGKRIPFELPTMQERLEFLERRLSKLYVDMSQFDLEKTALATHGCIYEHLNSAINAMIRKSSDHGIPMNQALLDEMIDSEIRHVVFEQIKLLPQDELQMIAAHHLGGALAGILFESRYLLDKMTLYPVAVDKEERAVSDRYSAAKENKEKELVMGGVFTYPFGDSLDVVTARDQEIKIKELLSGHIAEQVLVGNASYSYAPFNNRDQAFKHALTHVCKGVDIKSYSEKVRNELRDQAHELINAYEKELTELFTAHKNRMSLMMLTLMVSKELTAQDVILLLKLDEKAAGLFMQDTRRFEIIDLISGEKQIKSSDIIKWLTMPEEEFDNIFDAITKEAKQAETASQEEPSVSELSE